MATSSTTQAIAQPQLHRLPDLRSGWRITAAILLPLGPLGVVVARGIMPYWTNDDGATIVNTSMAQLGTMEMLTWLGLVMMPLLLLSILAMGFVARRGAPILATIGAGLTFFAFTASVATANLDYVLLVLAKHGWDAGSIEQVGVILQDHPVAMVSGIVFIIGHILGLILLGIAVGKANLAPWWVAIMLMISQPIHLVSAVILPSRALDTIAGWGFTTFAFAWVAVTVVRMSNDEWDLPPLVR